MTQQMRADPDRGDRSRSRGRSRKARMSMSLNRGSDRKIDLIAMSIYRTMDIPFIEMDTLARNEARFSVGRCSDTRPHRSRVVRIARDRRGGPIPGRLCCARAFPPPRPSALCGQRCSAGRGCHGALAGPADGCGVVTARYSASPGHTRPHRSSRHIYSRGFGSASAASGQCAARFRVAAGVDRYVGKLEYPVCAIQTGKTPGRVIHRGTGLAAITAISSSLAFRCANPTGMRCAGS